MIDIQRVPFGFIQTQSWTRGEVLFFKICFLFMAFYINSVVFCRKCCLNESFSDSLICVDQKTVGLTQEEKVLLACSGRPPI